MIEQIRNRQGDIVGFDTTRISNAIFKASQSIGVGDLTIAKELSHKVLEYLELMDVDVPDIELIQDVVEKVLIEEGQVKLAKEFIIYRYRRGLVRNDSEISNCKTVDNLLKKDIYLSTQAIHVLNNSDNLNPLGKLIFLDRY